MVEGFDHVREGTGAPVVIVEDLVESEHLVG